MTLEKHIELTGPYKGKSKYVFWDLAQAGDTIRIEYTIRALWGKGKPRIKFINETQGSTFVCGSGQAENYINKLNYNELK